jgi:hypothetical protein
MQGTDTYGRNMEVIWRIEPEIHEWLLNSGEDPSIVARDNLYVIKQDGDAVPYYERPPSLLQEKDRIKSMDLYSGALTFVVGIGLGYTARAILESMDSGHIMIILEPNPQILKLALNLFDFSKYLRQRKLFLVRPDSRSIRVLLMKLIGGGYIHGDFRIIPDPRSIALFPHYNDFMSQIELAFHYATDMLSGTTKAAKEMVSNELDNLLQVALTPDLEYLKEIFGKRPILIIGAGPSLTQSMDWIARLRDKMVLVAFAASWRNLLAHGIKPHIVVSSDKNVESAGMLKNTKHAQDIPLLCSSRANPALIKDYTGPRFVVPQPETLGQWLFGDISRTVCLHSGISVANFALEVAIFLEGNPLVFTGLDLAVAEYSHTEGHPLRQKISESASFFPVPGVRGTFVKSKKHLCTIRDTLEDQINEFESSVINVTEYGARIAGTRELTLEELDQELPLMAPLPEIGSGRLPVFSETQIKALVSKLVGFLKEAEIALKDCRKGVGLSGKLTQPDARIDSHDDRQIQHINLYTSTVERLIERHQFLGSYMGEIRHRAKIENARIAAEKDKGLRLRMELEKNRSSLYAAEKDLKKVVTLINREVAHLTDLHGHFSKLNKEVQNASDFYQYALFLLENKFYVEACREVQKALKKRKEFPEAFLLLGRIRIEQGLYAEAEKLVEKTVTFKGKLIEGTEFMKVIQEKKEELSIEKRKALDTEDSLTLALVSQELRHAGPLK